MNSPASRIRPVRVVACSVRPLGERSTHPIFRLDVQLDSGEELPLVLKQLRPRPGRDTRREALVYRRLLGHRRFGAPLLYAAWCDDARHRSWLVLEHVGSQRLDQRGTSGWERTVRHVARMHAVYDARAAELAGLGCLDHHDARYYRSLAMQARATLRRRAEPGARTRFDELVRRWFPPVVDLLDRQPRTLVHGGLTAHNVVLQPGGVVRLVDWETAGNGAAAVDLAKLLEGWGPAKPRLVTAYADEFARHASRTLDAGFDRALRAAGTLRILRFLHWWKEPCDDADFVDRQLTRLERAWRELAEGVCRG
ncbi:MAG: phosphotransferase [Haloechinothrix sp.]